MKFHWKAKVRNSIRSQFSPINGHELPGSRLRHQPSNPWLWITTAWLLGLSGCGPDQANKLQESYGVQLHLHGSMSEGPASMRAHAAAASRLGGAVDVLWWTDHDWRMAAHTYVDRFDFDEGLEESKLVPAPLRTPQFDGRDPLPDWYREENDTHASPPESLETVHKGWRLNVPPARLARDRMVEVTKREARHGTGSLHLAIRSTRRSPEQIEYLFQASRRRQIASLASGVILKISVLPVEIKGSAQLVIRVGLSQSNPEQSVRVDYVLSSQGLHGNGGSASTQVARSESSKRQIKIVTIPLEAKQGVWNDWQLDLSHDAERYGVGGVDNALVNFSVGLEVKGGGRAELYLDSLIIEREQVGEPLIAAARNIANSLSDQELTHHVGQEISYAAHIKAYGHDIPLIDFGWHPHGVTPREAVDHIHQYGGLASLNHFFGVNFSQTSHRLPASQESFNADLKRLIANEAYGADLLEVGYRSRGFGLDAFLELWDGLSNAGVHLVGVGVSDSHDSATGWSTGPNNFISWIYAPSKSEEDLLEGLRAGRVYFGDPTRFRGRLDIHGDQDERMGGTLVRHAGLHPITFRAEELEPGQTIRLIQNGRVVETLTAKTASLAHPLMIDVQESGFVRFEISEGEERIALSNPLYYELAP